MLRSASKAAAQAKPRNKHQAESLFATPDAYLNHDIRRLRDSFSGDWWLNVDYVVRGGFSAQSK